MTDLSCVKASVRQDIQQLRGLAIIFVVAYHAGGILPGGFVGVDMFFVISGFVIAQSVRERVSAGNFTLTDFVSRRIRRILPPLGAMLAVVIFLSTWMSPLLSRVQTVRTGIFAIFGGANLFLFRFRPHGYFVSSEKSNALLHTWSLSLEEQFYILFAVGVLLIVRLAKRSDFVQVASWIAGVVGLVSFALCITVSTWGIQVGNPVLERILGSAFLDSDFAFYMPMTRAWEFLIGVLLGFHSASITLKSSVRFGFRLTGLCLVLLSGLLTPVNGFPSLWTLLPTVGIGAIIVGGEAGFGLSGRFGTMMSWLGDRSYGWYLWHWPLMQFVAPYSQTRVSFVITALVAVFPAALSYRFLEQPIRLSLYWRTTQRTGVLAVICLLVPVVAVISTRSPEPDLDHHLDVQLGCMYGELQKLGRGGVCTLPVSESEGIAALVGDSHASHLSEAFVVASHNLGLDALLASRANSPFLFLEGVSEGGASNEQRGMVKHLIELGVRIVVVAQSTYQISFQDGRDWADAMRPVLEEFTVAGVRVVLVGESVFVGADPQDCSALQIYLSACAADIERQTSQLLGQRSRIQQEADLAQEIDSVVLFDSARHLCPEELCSLRRNGRWWWRDNGHISVYASQQLELPLQAAMRAALRFED